MLGSEQPYDPVPWFWSDQYELKLQIAGLSQGHDEFVVRGDPAESKFAVFYFKSGRIVAVDAINCAPEYMTGRKLIAQRAAIPVERLADTRMSLKDLAA
jgi:3-phenylpropionate/trans-cinnamate dioxygenase ferredoxin reductase subunit